MSANQRKLTILKTLLERVQQRASAPRTAVKVAAVAMAASAPAEARPSTDDEPTPLISASALSGPVADSLPVAEELTPSDEIMIVELSPSPGPTEVAELEVVEDELATEAARIEEALSSDGDDDEPPTSSEERPQTHHLEAMMAPMELDPISDRPTARITLPPEADESIALGELPKQPVPSIEEASAPEPEITISSEATEITLIPDEDELIELDEPLPELEPVGRVQPPALPGAEPAAAKEEPLELEEVIELEPEAELEPVSTETPAAAEAESVQAQAVTTPAEPLESKGEPQQLVADVVQRPASKAAEVAAVVGKVEPFAPTTFGELLDASLDL